MVKRLLLAPVAGMAAMGAYYASMHTGKFLGAEFPPEFAYFVGAGMTAVSVPFIVGISCLLRADEPEKYRNISYGERSADPKNRLP